MDEQTEQQLEEAQDNLEDSQYEEAENRAEVNAEVAEEYGAPTPEEKINQFTITDKAIKRKDSLKTTYLTKGELGLPLFSVRFYLDCASIADVYNSQLIKEYFLNKIQNTAASGMSNEGFIMKLNVTNRREVARRHTRTLPTKEEGENP